MSAQHFVYIIYSKSIDVYYKGYSSDPRRRVVQHNHGNSNFTSKTNDWQLVFIEEFATKKEALIREKVIKKYSKNQVTYLIESQRNLL
jgi:putative endonuclease